MLEFLLVTSLSWEGAAGRCSWSGSRGPGRADRKIARRYVEGVQAAGLTRGDGVVIEAVRPVRPNGHGTAWEALLGHEEQVTAWVKGGEGQDPLSIVKIEELLARQGCRIPYRTLHRFAVERCGFRARPTTVRVVEAEPGVGCQVDFAHMGLLFDWACCSIHRRGAGGVCTR